MLPRHLLARTGRLRTPIGSLQSPRIIQRSLHFSAPRRNEPPLKSPFQTFVDVLKEELQKSRELQDNVRQLQGDVDKLQDSEALKRAKDMYERARVRLVTNKTASIANRVHSL